MTRIYETGILPEDILFYINDEMDDHMAVEICLETEDGTADLSRPRLWAECKVNEDGWFAEYETDVCLVETEDYYAFEAITPKSIAEGYKSKDSLIHKLIKEYNRVYELDLDFDDTDDLVSAIAKKTEYVFNRLKVIGSNCFIKIEQGMVNY